LNIARFLYIRVCCKHEEYRDAYTQRFRTYTIEPQGINQQGIGRTYVDRHVDLSQDSTPTSSSLAKFVAALSGIKDLSIVQDEKDTYLPRLDLNFCPSLALRLLSSHSTHSTPARVVNLPPTNVSAARCLPNSNSTATCAATRPRPPAKPTCAGAALN
jgi:hypothetical protein